MDIYTHFKEKKSKKKNQNIFIKVKWFRSVPFKIYKTKC